MTERNLADDDVKLVHYTIVSVERENERILRLGDEPAQGYRIVTDNLTPDSFAAWTIAHYFQQPNHEELREGQKKYLRVCYEVRCRWPRESLHYEEKQLDRLEGIARALDGLGNRKGGGGTGGGTGGSGQPLDERVVAAIGELGGSATIGQLQSEIDHPREEIEATLERLVAGGRLSRTGRGVTARYRLGSAA